MEHKNYAEYDRPRSILLGGKARKVSTTLGQALGYNPFAALTPNWYSFRDGVLLANRLMLMKK